MALLEKLGGEAQQLRRASALAATALALEVHLHGHLAGLLDDRLLAGVGSYLSVGSLVVEELEITQSKLDIFIREAKRYMIYLAGLRHGQA